MTREQKLLLDAKDNRVKFDVTLIIPEGWEFRCTEMQFDKVKRTVTPISEHGNATFELVRKGGKEPGKTVLEMVRVGQGLRQPANRELVKRLSDLVEQHPDLRFGQILINHGFLTTYTSGPQFDPTTYVNDPFNEEPMTTLRRIEEKR